MENALNGGVPVGLVPNNGPATAESKQMYEPIPVLGS